MSAISLTNLKKSYNASFVLSDLSLNIKKGEVYGFIGMNGAGKTTTINLIMSLIQRDSGTIQVLGEDVVFTDQSYKQRIGYVPDVPMFPKHMNASEYLQYTLEVYGKEVDENHINETLAFVSLQNTKKRIHTYSRGMKQRLAIAQALIHDPEILIMDEPTSALDPIGRKDVMDIIKKLKGQKTIFYSTHILDDVEKVCDRVGILHQGDLILEESIENIKKKFSSNTFEIVFDNTDDYTHFIEQSIYEKIAQKDSVMRVKLKEGYTSKDLLRELSKLDVSIKEVKQRTKTIEEIFIEETK